MFAMFREDNGVEFKFIIVFSRLESCEKWKELRLQLSKTKNGIYDPDAPAPDRGKQEGQGGEGNREAAVGH